MLVLAAKPGRRAIAQPWYVPTTNRHACATPIRTIDGATSWFAAKRRRRRARAGPTIGMQKGSGAALGRRAYAYKAPPRDTQTVPGTTVNTNATGFDYSDLHLRNIVAYISKKVVFSTNPGNSKS